MIRSLFQLALEPKFGNENERKYCMVVLNRVEKGHATFWYYSSFVFWAEVIAFCYRFNYDTVTTLILTVAGCLAISAKLAILILAKSTLALRRGQLIGFVISNLVMLMAVKSQVNAGASPTTLLIAWGVGSVLALGLLAYRNHVHIFALIMFLIPFAWGIHGQPLWRLGLIIAVTMAVITSNAQIFIKRFIKMQMILSFRQQSAYTPKQVLMQAVESGTNVSELFKPELRYSVCICSDWRNFQSYAASVNPAQLAITLESYYNLQINLLDKEFPDGNYFIDWIADELFVVAFVTPTCNEACLLQRAINYAAACITARPTFCAVYHAPGGIDLGISAGTTTMGMLGPEGNKKATALGQIPGLSRRLQTIGKNLRQSLGNQDRIIVDPRLTLDQIDQNLNFKMVQISEKLQVKDLNFATVNVSEGRRQGSPERAIDSAA